MKTKNVFKKATDAAQSVSRDTEFWDRDETSRF